MEKLVESELNLFIILGLSLSALLGFHLADHMQDAIYLATSSERSVTRYARTRSHLPPVRRRGISHIRSDTLRLWPFQNDNSLIPSAGCRSSKRWSWPGSSESRLQASTAD